MLCVMCSCCIYALIIGDYTRCLRGDLKFYSCKPNITRTSFKPYAGWFLVLDSLLLDEYRLAVVFVTYIALSNYFCDFLRMVFASGGRNVSDSLSECLAYFCVLEYAIAYGCLLFHTVFLLWICFTCLVSYVFGQR